MKVRIDSNALMEVAIDKGLGVTDIARVAKMSQDTISKIFAGTPVYLKTATRLFQGLGKDERLKIVYNNQQMNTR